MTPYVKPMLALMLTTCTSAALAQDSQKGQRSFNKCMACHAVGPNAESKVGPQLNGLDGRRAGAAGNFIYSAALKNAGIVWTEESFRDFVKDPSGRVPGNKMTFAGIRSDQENSDLWAYIKQFSAEGSVK
jgi:cytochrome c